MWRQAIGQRKKKKMTIDERVDRLTGIVESLAASVVAHDEQIEKLIAIGESQSQRLDKLVEATEKNAANWERMERQWQAYLNTLPRQ
jgi:hypothetical protein